MTNNRINNFFSVHFDTIKIRWGVQIYSNMNCIFKFNYLMFNITRNTLIIILWKDHARAPEFSIVFQHRFPTCHSVEWDYFQWAVVIHLQWHQSFHEELISIHPNPYKVERKQKEFRGWRASKQTNNMNANCKQTCLKWPKVKLKWIDGIAYFSFGSAHISA